MRLVYEASNSLEAHMILNLIENAGLIGRIDGELLQGGAGDLQAGGVVRVMVDDSHYSDARIIVKEWDESQPLVVEENVKVVASNSSKSFLYSILSFVGGLVVSYFYFLTPITEDGIDRNEDGTIDESWTYINFVLRESKMDNNFDGNDDLIYKFDRRGNVESAKSDGDFDGNFETKMTFEYGNTDLLRSDTTGDGVNDYIQRYVHGILKSATFINPDTKRPIKIQHFGFFGLESAELDSDGDGKMDTYIKYDKIEEVLEKSNKKLHADT